MSKKKFFYWGISIGLVLAILLNLRIKNTSFLPIVGNVLAHKQDFWFYYEKIDSLYSPDKFRYFLFYKDGKLPVDRDSTLFILNKDICLSDSISSSIRNKVYLPLSAFPFIMKEKDNFILCHIDVIERKYGQTKYKLRKIVF